MATLLNKDPFTYQKERDGFLAELQRFHTNRGTPFSRFPYIGGKQVDLYLLYAKVTGLGGWEKVTNDNTWEDIQEHFYIPRGCTNASQALKNIYIRYLGVYEKVHHFGEEPNQRGDEDVDQGQHSARKKAAALVSAVPLSYNFQQHRLQEYAIRMLGLPRLIPSMSEYKKLESALESGLPNEVDFAFNVCTLLSNEGKHIIKVCRCPRIISLMLAHVGLFEPGPASLRSLHMDGWSKHTKRNFLRFWYESVEDKESRTLIIPESLAKPQKGATSSLTSDILSVFPEEDESLSGILHLGRELGIKEVEGQRVIQLASILRNLSFEEENMEALASNLLVFRFLMLCINSKYSNLRQLGLDTLGNIALKMVLDPVDYATTRLVLRALSTAITSKDKFKVVSGMDILARLCQEEQNEDVLADNLEAQLYEDVVAMLTVHDIQLIVHTLEALYQLSELGPVPCTRIAEVASAVDTLVSLVTVEAQSYGPGSLIGIKVVEQIPAGVVQQQLQQQHQQPQGTPARPGASTPQRQTIPTPVLAVSHQKPATPQQKITISATPQTHRTPVVGTPSTPVAAPLVVGGPQEQQADAAACNWIRAHYEPAPESLVTRMELYGHYVTTCAKLGTKNMANANSFANCVRVVYPQVEHQRLDKSDGSVDLQYKGLRKRPVPMSYPPTTLGADAQRAIQPRLLPSVTSSAQPSQNSPVGQVTVRAPLAAPTPRGVLHSALQQRLSSPPMSPQARSQEKGPISPNNYPTIQQALLNQPGPGGGVPSPVTSQPGSPLPSSPTATNKPTDSNLIKSLLANKVTQNMHRLQQQQMIQGQPGQLHPGLAGPVTQPEPKPSPRAKKRKASSSPTPTDPKVPALSGTPDQPRPDLPVTPKPEPMDTEPQAKQPTEEVALIPEATNHTNCVSGQVGGLNGTKHDTKPDQVCINGSKGGGKAQEPLVNGLCSPAPSEPEIESPQSKDSTNTNTTATKPAIDISQMKKDIAGQLSDKKEQISALLSENNKQQLFGLNGVVNHMGNGDCRMALQKGGPTNRKLEGKPPIENGYSSASETASATKNISAASGGVTPPSDCTDRPGTGVPPAPLTGPTHSSSAQTNASGSAAPSVSSIAASSDLSQQSSLPAVQTHTAPAASTLPGSSTPATSAGTQGAPSGIGVLNTAPSGTPAAVQPNQRPTDILTAALSQPAGVPASHASLTPALAPAPATQPGAPAPIAPAPGTPNPGILVSQLQAQSQQQGTTPGARVVYVQQNGQQVPMMLQQQLAPQVQQAGIPGAVLQQRPVLQSQSGVVSTSGQVVMANGQVMQGHVVQNQQQAPMLTQQLQGQTPAQGLPGQTTQPGQGQPGQVLVQQRGQVVQVSQHIVPPQNQPVAPGQPAQQVIAQPQQGQVMMQQEQVIQQQQRQIVQQPPQVIASGGQVIKQVVQQTPQGQIIQQTQIVQQGVKGQGQQGQIVQQTQIVQGQVVQQGQTLQQGQAVQQGQIVQGQVQQGQIVQGQAVQQGQILQGQAVQQGQIIQGQVQQGQVVQQFVTQSQLVASIQQGKVQLAPGSSGAVVVVSAPQQPGHSLNPQTLTQQMVAAQKLPGQGPSAPGTAPSGSTSLPVQPKHQMIVVSETQTGGPNPILQQQLQMPPKVASPNVAIAPAPADMSPNTKATLAKKKRLPPKKPGKKEEGRPPSASPPPPAPTQTQAVPLKFTCDWRGCNAIFDSWQLVSPHVMKNHFSRSIPKVVCQWDGCDGLLRAKWSFHTHLQDRHLTENVLRAAAVKRQQMGGVVPPTAPPTNPPVYPNDAAYQAIRRFTQRPPFPEFAETKEGPVTKHIRLTSALILRNLSRYSSQGRSLIKRYEEHLSYVALSSVESSNALANCMWELQQKHH